MAPKAAVGKDDNSNNSVCKLCQNNLYAKNGPPLCLAQCGHVFHKSCLFPSDKPTGPCSDPKFQKTLKHSSCPNCNSRGCKFKPVIDFFPFASEEPVEIADIFLKEPKLDLPPGEPISESLQMEFHAHSTLVHDYNEVIRNIIKTDELCEARTQKNAKIEAEIAALKKELEEVENQLRGDEDKTEFPITDDDIDDIFKYD